MGAQYLDAGPENEGFPENGLERAGALNSPMGGNYSLDEEENIWRLREGEVSRISGIDGSKMEAIKTKKVSFNLWQRDELGLPLFRWWSMA